MQALRDKIRASAAPLLQPDEEIQAVIPAQTVTLLTATERGEAAAAATHGGVSEVDERLERALGPAERTALRAGLVALIDIADELRRDFADDD